MYNNYSKRLTEFNSSRKYKAELRFLLKLMEPTENDVIVDYGCGIGTAIEYFSRRSKAKYYGFDIEYLGLGQQPDWYIKDINSIKRFNKVYFLHSIAHIWNIKNVLINIKKSIDANGEIFILTPNQTFDDYYKNKKVDKSYKPDEAVISHFDLDGLKKIFLQADYKVREIGFSGKKINNISERLYAFATVK